MAWTDRVAPDVVPWLLEPADPGVRATALERLLDRPADDPDVVHARQRAMTRDPIAAILAAQSPDGWWVVPGPGYGPKYTGTVWSFVFLDQLGADPADRRVQRACDYVLRWCATTSGGFGCSSSTKERPPPPSTVIHCLNGNLVRALIGFGHLDHPVVKSAVAWAAGSILGGGQAPQYYASSTPGPGFACAANERQPCAWGAMREIRALARIPTAERSPEVGAALAAGAAFLLSRDPADADYPMGYGNTVPSRSWFKLGFPSGYVSDVLQVVEALAELGLAGDPALGRVLTWVADQQGPDGRWANRYAYSGKLWRDIDRQGAPSKWVTLRAVAALRAADLQSGPTPA